MSTKTQERLERLKELERKRLEKQAAFFAETQYEPSILPKFESRITLSRSTVSDSDQQKYDSNVKSVTKSDDSTHAENEEIVSEVYEMEVSNFTLISMERENETSQVKEEELPTIAKQAEKHDSVKHEPQIPSEKKDTSANSTKVSNVVLETIEIQKVEDAFGKAKESEVEDSKKDESLYQSNVSNVVSLKMAKEDNSSCRHTMLKVDSEPKKTRENEKSNIEMSRSDGESLMSSIKNDTNRKTENSVVISDPPRTLSMSYVGPLSPTSTEKTRISVVRKMTLDSLPSVTTATQEINTESLLPTPIPKDFHTTETEKDKAKQTDGTKSYLTLKEFKLKTGSNKSSISSEYEEGLANRETNKSAASTHETFLVANLDVGPIVQSPSKEEKVIKEAEVGSTFELSENVTSSLASKTNNDPELRSSLMDEKIDETIPTEPKESSASETMEKFNKELEANFDAHFASVIEEEESQMAKLSELEKKREEMNKGKGKQEDLSHLSMRERFFRTQSLGRIKRPVKKQSVSEQIRASRHSKRNSNYSDFPRSESPGKAAEAESPPLARRNRLQARSIDRLRRRTIDSVPVLPTRGTSSVSEEKPKLKPVIDTDVLVEAFDRPERERRTRLEELERIRAQNRNIARRRGSDPAASLGASGSKMDYPSSLIVNRGSSENIAQFPIHENLESSFPRSRYSRPHDAASRQSELLRSVSIDHSSVPPLNRPILRPAYSESRLFPLDGGRLSNSGILSMSTESDLSELQHSTNQQQSVVERDNNRISMFSDSTNPLSVSLGRTHFNRPSSPNRALYSSFSDNLENSNLDDDEFELMFLPPHRRRAIHMPNNLLDPINHDHFLAECFLKKYTLKERCALIRDKIYGKDSSERGKPDGESHDGSKNKGDEPDISKNKCDEPETDTCKN